MGFLRKIISGSQPQSKYDLIKKFANERMNKLKNENSDFAFQAVTSGLDDINNWDVTMLEGLPESNVVTIVEGYVTYKNQGWDDSRIFNEIENIRKTFDIYPNLTPMPSNLNLMSYTFYRLKYELPNEVGFDIGENGFTRDFIDRIINASLKFYQQ